MKNAIPTNRVMQAAKYYPESYRMLSDWNRELTGFMKPSPLDWTDNFGHMEYVPLCDVKENDHEFLLEFDIPGLRKENIRVVVDNHRIIVSGERVEAKDSKDLRHYSSESFHGSFMRSIDLPLPIDENRIDAFYESGVLTVKASKQVSRKVKHIKIH